MAKCEKVYKVHLNFYSEARGDCEDWRDITLMAHNAQEALTKANKIKTRSEYVAEIEHIITLD